MPAQIPDSIADWSTTAGSNQPSGSANVGPDLDDNLRAMQVAVRQTYTRGTIASAATCDIGTVDAELITITGTTGISNLGATLGATGYGVHKLLTFAGVLTLTHSASLACITSANITTAAGDSCMVEYGASGWTMLWYARKSGVSVAVQSFAISDLSNATANKTLANGDFTQTWAWDSLESGDIGLQISGSSGTSLGTLMQVKWSSPSGLPPAYLFRVFGDSATVSTFDITGSSFTLRPAMQARAPGHGSNCTIGAQNAESATSGVNGGHMYIYAGNSGTTGTGGSVIAQGGTGTTTPGAVELRDSGGGAAAKVKVNTTGVELSGTGKAVLNTKHLFVDNTNGAPTITAGGGAGATIDGSDVAFEVTFGTGSPTSVTVTFANAWATAPLVLVSGTQSGQVLHYSAATNTVQILSSTAFSSGTKISVLCIGKQ